MTDNLIWFPLRDRIVGVDKFYVAKKLAEIADTNILESKLSHLVILNGPQKIREVIGYIAYFFPRLLDKLKIIKASIEIELDTEKFINKLKSLS